MTIIDRYLFSVIALFSFCAYSAQAENPLEIVRDSFKLHAESQLASYNFDFELNPDAKKLVEQVVDNLMTELRLSVDEELTEAERAKLVAKLSDIPLKFTSLETKLKAILKQKFALRQLPLPMEEAMSKRFQDIATREDAKKEWLSKDIAWQIFKEECLKDLGLHDFAISNVVADLCQILLEICNIQVTSRGLTDGQIKFILYGLIFSVCHEFKKNYLYDMSLLPILSIIAFYYGARNLCKEAYVHCDNRLDVRSDFNKIVYLCLILTSIILIELIIGDGCHMLLWTFCSLLIFVILYKEYPICKKDFKIRDFLGDTVFFVGETFKSTASLMFFLTKMLFNRHEIYQECLELGSLYIDGVVPAVNEGSSDND